MIALLCRRCTSTNIRKNGRTRTGQQQIHCRDCNFYSTLDTKTAQRQALYTQVERLHLERISQRGIARSTGVSRSTIIKLLKKKDPQPL